MAQVTNVGGSNKLDTELNLVPFIDLLSSLVLFLLLTAAWQHVSAIPASVASKGPSRTALMTEKRLEIRVTSGGFALQWPAGLSSAGFAASGEQLKILAKNAVAKGLKMANVTADDGVPYGNVVQAIDFAKEAGVPIVALGVN
jgi:biopolymer transport protein ExbD